jgi:hypothetical protein
MGYAESSWQRHSSRDQIRASMMLGAIFLSLFVSAFVLGAMLRGEMSPWAWTEFSIDSAKHGISDAFFVTALYLVFYASLVFLPYCVLRFVFWVSFINGAPQRADVIDDVSARVGLGALALACGIFLLTFLNSVLAFLRAAPTDVWSGWLPILCFGVSVVLVIGGVGSIRKEVAKIRVTMLDDSFVVNKCSRCGHMWASKAKEIERRSIRDLWNSTETAGGYPLE